MDDVAHNRRTALTCRRLAHFNFDNAGKSLLSRHSGVMEHVVELDTNFVQDPHRLYDQLRAEVPVTPVGGAPIASGL